MEKYEFPDYTHLAKPNARYAMIGNIHGFFFNSQGVPLVTVGPHWTFFAGLNCFIFFLALIFIFAISPSVSNLNTVIGTVVFGFLLTNYVLAGLSNPGIPKSRVPDEGDLDPIDSEFQENYCKVCDVLMEEGTKHCEDCGVCIEELDHHCPWTSKCVGKGNLSYFYGFLLGILFTFIYIVVTLGLKTKYEHQ
mmetsp:Transcript_6142/g.9102  ORF Transcript_6142/g.9102 Transcript_6142/m.9102 type:complete len:192 (-) Transcript_6142:9-584(-)